MKIFVILACSLLEVAGKLKIIPHPFGDALWHQFDFNFFLEHPVNEYSETYMISSSSRYLFEHVFV